MADRWRRRRSFGIASGFAGVALTLLLHLVQHLAFGYTENTFLLGVERAPAWRRVAAMACGGLLVAAGWWLLRRRVDVEEISVTRALRDPDPRLPLVPTFTDAVLQIIGVGVGASLGREGAPRQAGAALAEVLTRHWGMSPPLRRTLVACGAGAGLAAVYNVPVAGALFALELLLVSSKPVDIVLAVVTSGIATVVAWPVLSSSATYWTGPTHFQITALVLAAVLGPLAGLLGVGFVRLMTVARRHAPTGALMMPTIAAAFACVGGLAIAYPQLLGNGKGQAQLSFAGILPLALAGVLVMLKPAATATCLAGGAIGGLLTPALATGAALGVFIGRLWAEIWPDASVTCCAIVGAAALLAATQRAPLMAVAITLELLQSGEALLLPIVVAVALGITTAALLDRRLLPTWWLPALTRLRRHHTPTRVKTKSWPGQDEATRERSMKS